jgi:ribonuclease HII
MVPPSVSLPPIHEHEYHLKGYEYVIGVDEAGRGPLAGPVVSAAVILKNTEFTVPVTDSKRLSARQREIACQHIMDQSWWSINVINESVIDHVNILNATYLAMNNAIEDVICRVSNDLKNKALDVVKKMIVLIDGNRFKTSLPIQYETLVKGDLRTKSIACASILAKVYRDRLLKIYDRIYPEYGFAVHKGYPTAEHRKRIAEFGVSPIHRKSFKLLVK